MLPSGGLAALQFVGLPDTLTVLPGSRIIGAINLGGGGDTVNMRAVNQNLTFDTLSGGEGGRHRADVVWFIGSPRSIGFIRDGRYCADRFLAQRLRDRAGIRWRDGLGRQQRSRVRRVRQRFALR